jgi:hypothetical protein
MPISYFCVLRRIVTFEDVLEELLQEQIYDENDQMEKEAEKIARWVVKRWRHHKRRREMEASGMAGSMGTVVSQALAARRSDAVGESSFLLAKEMQEDSSDNSFFGLLQNLMKRGSSSEE